MRRADATLYAIVAGFGAFVVMQIVDRQASIPPDPVVEVAEDTLGYSTLAKRRRPERVAEPSDDAPYRLAEGVCRSPGFSCKVYKPRVLQHSADEQPLVSLGKTRERLQ